MTEDQIIRKIAVIFATDVVNFSTLMEKNENSTLRSLRACRDILGKSAAPSAVEKKRSEGFRLFFRK